VIAWLDLIWAQLFIACVYIMSATLAYIVIVASLITIALGTINERITRDSRDATFQAGKDDREWITATERNKETVVSRGMVSNLANRWSLSAYTRLGEGLRTRSVNLYFAAMMQFIRNCVRIAVIGVGIWLVINDALSLGSVFAAGILARMAYSLIEKAMLKWRDMTAATKAYQRIKSSLEHKTESLVSVPTSSGAEPLFVEALSFRYPNQTSSVFRNINVTVNPGEVLCVIGPSAVGKTTFTRLASGLLVPRSGKIRLGDVDVSRLQEVTDKRYIGHLPQQVSLFQGTVRENIAGMELGDIDQVVSAAKLMGVHQVIMTLPQGYDTRISDCEPLLSGGQRKKIAITRAFYGDPALIILDEPLPHLDKSSRATLRAAISTVKSNGTIVVLTNQSKSLSRIADKVIAFRNNKYKVFETQEEIALFRKLKKDSGTVYQLNKRRKK
jgi:ATP-binding cassette, subfamily C, type I secretion system permease/ATPase